MSRTLGPSVALASALATAAQAQTPADGRAILEKARAAAVLVRHVGYRAEYYVTGLRKVGAAQWAVVTPARGRVVLGATDGRDPLGYALRVDGESLLGAERRRIVKAYDGHTIQSLDHERKTLWVGHPRGRGRLLLAGATSLAMRSLVAQKPFARALAAQRIELEGRAVIGGVECHVVKATHGAGESARTQRWFLGTEDLLPRRREDSSRQTTRHTSVLTLTDLRVHPAEARCRLDTPAGFVMRVHAPAARRDTSLRVGSAAPAWELIDARGRAHRSATYRGKVVVLEFWATWCRPCVAMLADLQRLHDDYAARGVTVMAVNTLDAPGAARSLFRRRDYSVPLLLEGERIQNAFGVRGLPTIYVIGKDGRVAHRKVGAGPARALRAAVEACLEAKR